MSVFTISEFGINAKIWNIFLLLFTNVFIMNPQIIQEREALRNAFYTKTLKKKKTGLDFGFFILRVGKYNK